MHKWLVIIDFEVPISIAEMVAIQAALGEDQFGIGTSDFGISVIVRDEQSPQIPRLPNMGSAPPNVLVTRLPEDACISGRPSLTDWWRRKPQRGARREIVSDG